MLILFFLSFSTHTHCRSLRTCKPLLASSHSLIWVKTPCHSFLVYCSIWFPLLLQPLCWPLHSLHLSPQAALIINTSISIVEASLPSRHRRMLYIGDKDPTRTILLLSVKMTQLTSSPWDLWLVHLLRMAAGRP